MGAGDSKLHCFDASTGNEDWSYTTGDDIESSPLVVGTDVYFTSNDGKLYSVTTSGSGPTSS